MYCAVWMLRGPPVYLYTTANILCNHIPQEILERRKIKKTHRNNPSQYRNNNLVYNIPLLVITTVGPPQFLLPNERFFLVSFSFFSPLFFLLPLSSFAWDLPFICFCVFCSVLSLGYQLPPLNPRLSFLLFFPSVVDLCRLSQPTAKQPDNSQKTVENDR